MSLDRTLVRRILQKSDRPCRHRVRNALTVEKLCILNLNLAIVERLHRTKKQKNIWVPNSVKQRVLDSKR